LHLAAGSAAATAAVPATLRERLGTVGDVEACRECIAAEAEAGADLHRVHIAVGDTQAYAATLERLLVYASAACRQLAPRGWVHV